MEPQKPGNPNMPDFKEMEDRVMAPRNAQPTLVIKTNLDPENPEEFNPYAQNSNKAEKDQFDNFFEE
ncbi:hypothetical protein D0469_03780 [Peribacillus saganii]|uniref:Uncharacterized protein n=1 Tax=Peribacillus saganii TaxID=2303992 RepID=A0A372LT43_9BACI|nr:hypothetical protein [Peribacillus saganii]RFU71067.1 hypothetical protein D0469_03780 [Peribacillus saganii]